MLIMASGHIDWNFSKLKESIDDFITDFSWLRKEEI